MKCPKCGGDSKVKDGVQVDDTNQRLRQRKCLKCDHTFYTRESVIIENIAFKYIWRANHRLTRKDRCI